jgi:hypothetical protein
MVNDAGAARFWAAWTDSMAEACEQRVAWMEELAAAAPLPVPARPLLFNLSATMPALETAMQRMVVTCAAVQLTA